MTQKLSSEKKLNIKATGLIAVAISCSRVLGLIREILFNALFGSSLMGIFIIAFRAPNILRDLFAEGALSVSFTTVFSQKIESESDEAVWSLASKMITFTTVLMIIITLLGIILTKPLICFMAPGIASNDKTIIVLLAQIMFPFILLVSLAALVMGILNAKNVFGIPALASSFFNIGSIIGGVSFGWLLDPTFGDKALIGLAVGTLLGGFLQLAIQLPSLKRLNFRFNFDFSWKDEGVHKILILTLPAIIAASAVQINVLINSAFASYIGKEAVTWLNSAFRIMQLPIGMFGVAIASITLPVISRIAASKEHMEFSETLSRALQLTIFLTMPAAVGLWFFAHPIISLIYQHGKFTGLDSLQTALALQYYSLGLVAYSCIKVLSPAFYSINKKWIPMFTSLASIGLNIGLNYLFIFKLGMEHGGLALSTIIAASLNFLILYGFMIYLHNLNHADIFKVFLYCSLVTTILGGISWFVVNHYSYLFSHQLPLFFRIVSLLLTVIVFALSYVGLAAVFRIEAACNLINFVTHKLGLQEKKAQQV